MKNLRKNKRGVSEVLGYILLVSFAVFMSVLVYQGLKTYVPVNTPECPDGISIFVQSVTCNLSEGGTLGVGPYNLRLNIKNNGRYNIAGYFIHATNNSNQTVATIPLINNLNDGTGNVYKLGNLVLFEASTSENSVNISNTAFAEYRNVSQKMYSIDILPARFQEEKNRLRIVSCGDALVREKVNCA